MRCKIALLAFIVTGLSSIATNSYSAPGDTLASFNLPAGNATDFGLSVAVDPSGNIFFTRYGVPTLYRTNASGSTVSSVAITPSIALGELVWNPSSNLLLAGSEDSTPLKGLYSLNPATGVATNLFVVGVGLTFKVDGLAVDGAGTVWYHPDGSSKIYFFSSGNVSGTPNGFIVPKNSANIPILCCIAGVEAGAGNTLIVHLYGPPRLLTVDKSTGNYISELPYTPPPNVGQEGISCDTVNFAPRSAVWVRNYGVLTAVEVAPGSCPSDGLLKVCKVAGPGIAVGTPFTFTAGTSTFTVPAGPAPGGTCVVGPSFAVGTTVTVDEVVPAGDVVSNIVVAPPGQLVGTPNLATGTVNVLIGTGVTEVTFTDKRTGYLEICKRGHVGGNFTFNVNPGNLGPFVVPAQACSPAIEVAAGPVVIHEMPTLGTVMTPGCATIPAGNQLGCNTGAQTSTVTVVPGNISTMTIAFVTNAPHLTAADGAATPGRTQATGTGTTLACAPNPASLRGAVTCTAKVTAFESKTGTPTGAVRFIEGDTTLATVQISPDDGTAVFTTSTLAAGPHAIVVSYGGDAVFGQSVSDQFTVTVRP